MNLASSASATKLPVIVGALSVTQVTRGSALLFILIRKNAEYAFADINCRLAAKLSNEKTVFLIQCVR